MAISVEPGARKLDDLQKIVALCKRRGFVFASAEIYGGFANTYDYGPLGVLLKNNVRDAWIRSNVQRRDDMELLDAALITSPKVWVASGHVAEFNDPLVQCLGECKSRFRADQIDTTTCPTCGGKLSEPRMFNTMFTTHVGPVADDENIAYLPPETAQGMFVNFVNVATTMRRKLPFGIAQVRKSFRNEITPGNFVFRTLEFEQMEIEFFVEPGTDEEWFGHWVDARERWYIDLGIRPENLRRYEHPAEKLSHYSKRTVDLEYRFPFGEGWGELEGIANRSKGPDGSSWDLWQHEQASGQRLSVFDEEKKLHIRPGVVEPAAGLTRAALTFLIDAYDEEVIDAAKNDVRTVLHLHPALAPYKACVLPLYRNKPELVKAARAVYEDLRRRWMVTFDSGSNIGKLYRRQDEIGTPYCITVDFQTLDDHAVTIRDRDSMDQTQFGRVPIADLRGWLEAHLDY
ncbi:MAG TPA: glycine--tRNA ligase [Chloroflexota bacterium]|jgi:glycyl-tRNA synthetase|nr:glycine--tRNA ligase [Chloroflexota bacterium]